VRGRVRIAELALADAPVDPHVGRAGRRDAQCMRAEHERLAMAPGAAQQMREVAERLRMVRVVRERGAECLLRVRNAALRGQCEAQVVEKRRVLGSALPRVRVGGDRLVQAPALAQQVAEVEVRIDIGSVAREHATQERFGGRRIAPAQGHGEQQACTEVARIVRKHAATCACRGGLVATLQRRAGCGERSLGRRRHGQARTSAVRSRSAARTSCSTPSQSPGAC
jgi:hypothetical protein